MFLGLRLLLCLMFDGDVVGCLSVCESECSFVSKTFPKLLDGF